MEKNTSVFGLSENAAAALSYLAGPFTGLVVLILERENKFVKFHALQSTIWFLFLYVIRWGLGFILSLFGWIPVAGWLLGLVMHPVFWAWGAVLLITKLYLMLRAYNGAAFKLPFVGDVAWAQVYK